LRKAHEIERQAWRAQQNGRESIPVEGCETCFRDPFHLGILYRQIFVDCVYDFDTTEAAPVIIDCGGNIGLGTIRMKRRHPAARVYAFEPDPEFAAIFEKNVKSAGLSDVRITQAAVWSSTGTMRFKQDGGLAGHLDIDGGSKGIDVPTFRLRDLLSAPVDFLKIDIEGAELEVLRDCADLLGNVRRLFVESHTYAGRGQNLDEILAILRKAGFRYWLGTVEGPRTLLSGVAHVPGVLEMCVNVTATRDGEIPPV
jgi:FkbM family methyltransferase